MSTPDLPIGAFDEKIAQQFSHAKEAMAATDWKKQDPEPDIVVFTRHESGSKFLMMKSVVSIRRPVNDVLQYIRNVESSPPDPNATGPRITERQVLHTVDGDPQEGRIYYMVMAPPMKLVSPRQNMLYSKVIREDPIVYIMRTSVECESLLPVTKKAVRSCMHFQLFMLEEISFGTKLTLVGHGEPGGNMPAKIYNKIIPKQALMARMVKEELERGVQ